MLHPLLANPALALAEAERWTPFFELVFLPCGGAYDVQLCSAPTASAVEQPAQRRRARCGGHPRVRIFSIVRSAAERRVAHAMLKSGLSMDDLGVLVQAGCFEGRDYSHFQVSEAAVSRCSLHRPWHSHSRCSRCCPPGLRSDRTALRR